MKLAWDYIVVEIKLDCTSHDRDCKNRGLI
jgi:hypothetical protein